MPTENTLEMVPAHAQLSDSLATVMTATRNAKYRVKVANTSASLAQTIVFTVRRLSDSADMREKRFILQPNEQAEFVVRLRKSDILKASTTTAATVDAQVELAGEGDPSGLFIWDALGNIRQTANSGLNGLNLANVADSNANPGIPVIIRKAIADAASSNTSIVMTQKLRVIDVYCIKVSAAGHATEDTMLVGKGASAITDAIVLGNADKAIKRASTIDDANYELAVGDSLRFTWVKGASGGNNVACEVVVICLPIA